MVMKAAADSLTPVILELGGKDAFIICDDANPCKLAQLACRGVFQNMGQNCAGPERFLVHEAVYDQFCEAVSSIVNSMLQGSSLDSEFVDCGACCMPQSMSRYQELVDDAVSKGAKVLAGGTLKGMVAQLYPPTVLAGVTEDCIIANEEIFGPIMCIFKVRDDAEALRIANESAFGLSGCVHSGSHSRAAHLCNQLEAGMASVNDLEGTTYLSQSLPFGGQKDSGFGRFAGPEGLRGLCHVKSVVENRLSFIAAEIPAQLTYPANGQGPAFCKALIDILYGYGLIARLKGVFGILKTAGPAKPKKQ
jgi:acyl-CoA reductase-like NAD-dependent aldehyde dehydrogenase